MSTSEERRRRGAGQRAGLSRTAVLAAARHIADEQGVDRLTMRQLAGELGVLPNALYSYFPSKEALLDALIDDLLGDIDLGDSAAGDWRAGLVRVMDTSRRLLLAHPQLVPVFLGRPGLGPNAARLGEVTFTLLRQAGLDGDRAVEAFRVLLIYSLGFAAFQAPRLETDSTARTQQVETTFAGLPEDVFPLMRRLARDLAAPTTDSHYHTGLRWLIDGLGAEARGDCEPAWCGERGAKRSGPSARA